MIKKTPSLNGDGVFRGPDRIRTDDPHNANVVRSQLRYKPITIFFDLIIIAPRRTDVKIFQKEK